MQWMVRIMLGEMTVLKMIVTLSEWMMSSRPEKLASFAGANVRFLIFIDIHL